MQKASVIRCFSNRLQTVFSLTMYVIDSNGRMPGYGYKPSKILS
jgi:hypothetical protein